MSTTLREPPQSTDEWDPAVEDGKTVRRRSGWRRRLIDVERGMAQGMKRESTLYAYMFSLSMVIAAALVLGLGLVQWTIVIMCSTVMLSAELFNMALRTLAPLLNSDSQQEANDAIRMASAAVFATFVGATAAIGLVFIDRVVRMWHG
jgi:diacylglycerol kinase